MASNDILDELLSPYTPRHVPHSARAHMRNGATWELGALVYFIRSGPYVKIGFSSDIASRFDALQAAHPLPLELLATIRPGSVKLERQLHETFAEYRTETGREWFHYVTPIVSHIAAYRVGKQKRLT